MAHSKHYDKVKEYWERRLWTEPRVRNAVAKGWITAAEFEEITGTVYARNKRLNKR